MTKKEVLKIVQDVYSELDMLAQDLKDELSRVEDEFKDKVSDIMSKLENIPESVSEIGGDEEEKE